VNRFRDVPLTIAIVAAHPDDETIGAASLLLRSRRAAVVHLTDGAPRDPRLWPHGIADREAYARLRREEALAALAVARVAAEDVFQLAGVDQEAAVSVARLSRALAAWLEARAPRVVVTHPFEGGHPDHDAAAVISRAALALLRRRAARVPRLVEMTSYHLRDGRLVTGAFLSGPPGAARALRPGQRAAKRRMLDRYGSQREVLAPFGVAVERFRRGAAVDVTTRPHPAPLLYEALGWTTFERFRDAVTAGLEELRVAVDEEAARWAS
jgi:N-acetylglucosamine malate deacetylase 2